MFAFRDVAVLWVIIGCNRAETDVDGFHFAAVKAALVAAFGIADADRPRFFARLEHLRRVGVMGERPGKGQKVVYSLDQIDRLLFVFQLSRFSIEPVVAVALIESQWKWRRQHRDAEEAVKRGDASISQLFEVARGRRHPLHICVTVQIEDFVSTAKLPTIGHFTGHPKSLEGFYGWLGEDQNSASVFDLSSKLHRLDAALAAASTPEAEPPRLSKVARNILRVGRRARGEE
jgi:hypothetical protein